MPRISAGFFGRWRPDADVQTRLLYHYPAVRQNRPIGHLFILSFHFFTFRFAWLWQSPGAK